MGENAVAQQVVDAAFRVHTTLGPGLLESVYEAALAYELEKRGLSITRQQGIPVVRVGPHLRRVLLRPGGVGSRRGPDQTRHYSHRQRSERMISRKVAKVAKENSTLSLNDQRSLIELPVGPLSRRAVAERA